MNPKITTTPTTKRKQKTRKIRKHNRRIDKDERGTTIMKRKHIPKKPENEKEKSLKRKRKEEKGKT